MVNPPEIFFDYIVDENADQLNESNDFVLYSRPCPRCEPPCSTVLESVMHALDMKLHRFNVLQAKKLIAYHFDAYKGDKQDFILGASIALRKCVTGDKLAFTMQYLQDRKDELDTEGKTYVASAYTKSVKLKWNGQKNALTDMFRQLKNIVNSKNEPLISASYEDIALFIKEGFTDFENTELSTILGQLKRAELIKKTDKRVVIECNTTDINGS